MSKNDVLFTVTQACHVVEECVPWQYLLVFLLFLVVSVTGQA